MASWSTGIDLADSRGRRDRDAEESDARHFPVGHAHLAAGPPAGGACRDARDLPGDGRSGASRHASASLRAHPGGRRPGNVERAHRLERRTTRSRRSARAGDRSRARRRSGGRGRHREPVPCPHRPPCRGWGFLDRGPPVGERHVRRHEPCESIAARHGRSSATRS